MPDTVTFISDIPEKVHVSVRDKGTNLWRSGILRHPSVDIDFKEYSSNGVMRFTHSDLMSALKGTFGSTAQITLSSIDSLRLVYTTNKGKRVPVTVVGAIYPASGSILEGDIRTEPSSVYVYGDKSVVEGCHRPYRNEGCFGNNVGGSRVAKNQRSTYHAVDGESDCADRAACKKRGNDYNYRSECA